jgi:hypothetical protein
MLFSLKLVWFIEHLPQNYLKRSLFKVKAKLMFKQNTQFIIFGLLKRNFTIEKRVKAIKNLLSYFIKGHIIK